MFRTIKSAGEIVYGEVVHIADKVLPVDVAERMEGVRNIRAGLPRLEDGSVVIPVVGTDIELRFSNEEHFYVKRRGHAT